MGSSPSEVPSLSKSALLLSPCIYWAGKGVQWYDNDYDPESKREKGTAVHSLIDEEFTYQYHNDGNPYSPECTDPSVRKIAAHGLRWLYEQISSTRLTSVQSEVAISINWAADTAEILTVKNREYPIRKGGQNGTADIVARYGDNGLYVGDWKTGDGVGWEEQVLSLLYGFLKAFTAQGLPEPVEFIGACLKVTEEGCWPIEKTYTRNDLDLHADAMRMRWEEIESGKVGKAAAGIHCTQYYCPHLAYCTEIKQYVTDLASASFRQDGKVHLQMEKNLRLTDKPVDDFEAGGVVEILAAAKRQIKYLDEQMKKHILNGGRVISGQFEWKDRGNGYRWGKVS